MTREQVAEFSIEYVQALDEEANLDEAVAPDLDDEQLLEFYRLMRLARRTDERAVALQRRGELGTYAPGVGPRINDAALYYLEAPVKRVTGYDVPFPLFAREEAYRPDAERIRRGIERALSA